MDHDCPLVVEFSSIHRGTGCIHFIIYEIMYIRHKILNFVSLHYNCCAFKRLQHAFPPAHTGLSDVFTPVSDCKRPESAAPDSPGATEPRSYWNTEIKGTLSPALKSTVIFKRPGCRQLQWRWESTSILELNLNGSDCDPRHSELFVYICAMSCL